MTAINVNALRFAYSAEDVLRKISLEIPKGQLVSILGPNGSGKTTLLKSLCKLLTPYEGRVALENKCLTAFSTSELAKSLAVVHQGDQTQFDFSVEEVVLMGRFPHLRRFQNEGLDDFKIAERAMQQTSVTHLRAKRIQEISGGERQRVMIARALTQQTDLLLLDEPISHLDIKYQLEVLKLCRQLKTDHGMTILTTLHDINMAARFSDHIVLMRNGEILEFGPPHLVITPENIARVYEVPVEIMAYKNYPVVLPL